VFKNKAFLVTMIIMLTLAVLLSCAPAASTEKPDAATTPSTTTPSTTQPSTTAPSTLTPPTPPPTPPGSNTPAAPAEIKTSFEASTYTNDELGFSIKYPKNWVKKDASGETVLSISAGEDQTADSVSVNVIAENKNFAAAAKSIIEGSGAFKQYSAKAKVESEKATTLADGKTAASEAVFSAKIVIYDVYLYCFGTNTGGKTIVVVTYTLKNDAKNKELIKEIAKTLTLTK